MKRQVVGELPYYAAHVRLDRERGVWIVVLRPGEDPYEHPRDYGRNLGLDAAYVTIEAARHRQHRGFLEANEVIAVELPNGEFAVFPWWRE